MLAKLLVVYEYSLRSSGVNMTQSSAFRLQMAELGWHLAELMASTPYQVGGIKICLGKFKERKGEERWGKLRNIWKKRH